jgi:hypothetical protein
VSDGLDLAVAQRLAAEVMAARQAGQRRSWRKVTTLLDLFRVSRLTPDVRRRIDAALRSAGIETEPAMSEVSRDKSVRLHQIGVEEGSDQSTAALLDGLRVTEWHRDGSVTSRKASLVPAGADAVVWYDIDADSDPATAYEVLRELLGPALSRGMIDDLLTADIQPKVAVHRVDGAEVRAVSFVGVEASEGSETSDPDSTTKTGELTFQLVETLVAERWLVTCWHRGRTCTGATHDRETEPILQERAALAVRAAWADHPGMTPGDLGLCLARFMVDTYRSAYRITESWLESWELEFYRSLEATEATTLNNLLALVSEFRSRLAAFNHARQVTPDKTWFPRLSQPQDAERMDDVLDRALKGLARLFGNIRADIDLLIMNGIASQARSSAEQARSLARTADLAQQSRDASQRLQHQLEKVAALLLVPTLIAGVFGANTALPGEGTWAGFWVMLTLMLVSGVALYAFLRLRDPAPPTSQKPVL